jgi:hypothetical protein
MPYRLAGAVQCSLIPQAVGVRIALFMQNLAAF